MNERTILHCDMNNFFASVELLEHPELQGVPVAVCGDPASRHGIILAKNNIAKAQGVKTAETIWQAKKKSPNLHLLAPHYKKYSYYSKKINAIYAKYTDLVEPFSIDESWLDVTASRKLFGDGKSIADDIRKNVKNKTGLTLSAGVSFNKIFAKMGSNYKKPDATTVISQDNYKDILWPLPAKEMFFVGKSTLEKLNNLGINTIGDIASADKSVLVSALGKHGAMLSDYANGLDSEKVSPINSERRVKSVSHGVTFKRNISGKDDIKIALTYLSDKVSARLRRYCLKAQCIKVEIKNPDFKTVSKQRKLDHATFSSEEISNTAFSLVKESCGLSKPIRLLTVGATSLCDEDAPQYTQLDMFTQSQDAYELQNKMESIDKTMDSIRDKFGSSSISFGSLIGNDIGLSLDEDLSEENSDDEFSY